MAKVKRSLFSGVIKKIFHALPHDMKTNIKHSLDKSYYVDLPSNVEADFFNLLNAFAVPSPEQLADALSVGLFSRGERGIYAI